MTVPNKGGESLILQAGVSAAEAEQLTMGLIKDGWGVFAHHGGMNGGHATELRAVHTEKVDADAHCSQLEQDEGYIVYEVTGDPESTVYDSLDFGIGQVTLSDVKVVAIIEAGYTRVEK